MATHHVLLINTSKVDIFTSQLSCPGRGSFLTTKHSGFCYYYLPFKLPDPKEKSASCLSALKQSLEKYSWERLEEMRQATGLVTREIEELLKLKEKELEFDDRLPLWVSIGIWCPTFD